MVPNLRRVFCAAATALPLLLVAGRVATAQQPGTPVAEQQAAPAGLLPEPGFITRGVDLATRTIGDGSSDKAGFYADVSNMITGAGWVSVGPGYRWWIGGDRLFIDTSAAISWRGYKIARARVELTNLVRSRVALGSEIKWQDFTQISYFGGGAESLVADRSEYRLRSTNVVAYTNVRPVKWLTIGGRGGWLHRPALMAPGGYFSRRFPDTREVFPGSPAFAVADQPSYAHGELFVSADTRDNRSHPLRGGLYRGGWTRYWDQVGGAFGFQRFDTEAAHFISVANSRLTFALHGWLVGSDTAEGDVVPFYLLPSLGGNNTLRAYADYRFHDRHLALVNAEARIALFEHLDAALFTDAGNVAARIADLNLDRTSFGIGFRMHSNRSTFARLDVAHGREGWRVAVTTSDPLHLSRLSRRLAAQPFVP